MAHLKRTATMRLSGPLALALALTTIAPAWSGAAVAQTQTAPSAAAPSQPSAPIPGAPTQNAAARSPSDCGVWRYVQDLAPPSAANPPPQSAGVGSASGAPQGPAGGASAQGASGGKEGAGAQAGGASPTGAGAALAATPLAHAGPWVCAAWKAP